MKTQKISKKEMLETIKLAVQKMEHPFPVELTPKAVRALMSPKNEAYLRQAHTWANYILNWNYGRIPSDSITADYDELLCAIRWAVLEI